MFIEREMIMERATPKESNVEQLLVYYKQVNPSDSFLGKEKIGDSDTRWDLCDN